MKRWDYEKENALLKHCENNSQIHTFDLSIRMTIDEFYVQIIKKKGFLIIVSIQHIFDVEITF